MSLPAFNDIPLVYLSVAFVAGMLAASFGMEFGEWQEWMLFAILCLLAVGMAVLQVARAKPWSGSCFGLVAWLFVFVLGATLYVCRVHEVEACADKNRVEYAGIVAEMPEEKPKTIRVVVRCAGRVNLLAYVRRDGGCVSVNTVRVGDSVRLRPSMVRETSPFRPVRTAEDDSFVSRSYKRYLFSKGVAAVCLVPSGQFEVVPQPRSLLRALAEVRQSVHAAYSDGGLSDGSGALVEAMTTGNRSGLERSVRTDFAQAGVAHVLALSGFHLAVLLAIADLLVLRSLLPLGWRRATVLLVVSCVWAFVLLAGMPASLVRAALMCSFVQCALALGLESHALSVCALSAMLMLGAEPLMLDDISFQLSYICVLGIYAFHPRLFYDAAATHSFLRFFFDTALLSVACSLASFPLVAYHFGYVPLLSVLSNVVVGVLAMLLMWGAVLWWGVCWWAAARDAVADALLAVSEWMAAFAHGVARLPFSTLPFAPSVLQVVLLYAMLALLVGLVRVRRPLAVKLFLAALCVFCLSVAV